MSTAIQRNHKAATARLLLMTNAVDGILLSELRHVADDLRRFVGQPLRDVWVPTRNSVVLSFGAGDQVLVETWPLPRAHPIRRRPPNPKKPFSFQGLLRSRLHGRLDAVEVVGQDRVLALTFGPFMLHARLFGRGGGLWLLEGDRVLASSEGPAPDALPELSEVGAREDPPRFSPERGQSWGEAAEAFFERAARDHARTDLAQRLAGHLGRERKKARRLVANLEADLSAAERADDLRHRADCLAATLHRVPKGQREVEVPDLNDPDGTLRLQLDPARTPADNLNRMYDKAGRLERAVDHLLVRLEEAQTRERALDAALVALPTLDLGPLRAQARTWSLPEGGRRQAAAPALPWVVWQAPGGQEVLIGRSDAGNHALTFRRARGRDWWLHLRGRPSAHVVLPMAHKGDAPPLELLLGAAQVLLQQARIPPGTAVDVQYARVADLRAIKGGAPGQVQVLQERVLHVTSDPEALTGWTRGG